MEVPVTYLEKTTKIRVEIQIRSFAMDYWAELDNQMCYKKNAGQIENVERATKDYSDVIAKVDNQMLELRRQIRRKSKTKRLPIILHTFTKPLSCILHKCRKVKTVQKKIEKENSRMDALQIEKRED